MQQILSMLPISALHAISTIFLLVGMINGIGALPGGRKVPNVVISGNREPDGKRRELTLRFLFTFHFLFDIIKIENRKGS
jgi:hypothetical protein